MERWFGPLPTIEPDPPELAARSRRPARVPIHPRRSGVALSAIAALAAVACAPAASDLAGRQFLVVGVTEQGAAKVMDAGLPVRVAFAAATMTAFAGCTTIELSYRIEGGRLDADVAGTTGENCNADGQSEDAWLEAFLASRPRIRLVGSELTLDNGQIVIGLLDREAVEPGRNLVGRTWAVELVVDGEDVVEVPREPIASLTFKADNTVDVDTGCNRGSGTWKLEADGVEITTLGMTKMACAGPAAELESAVLGVLGAGRLAAVINGDDLTLGGARAALQLRAVPPSR